MITNEMFFEDSDEFGFLDENFYPTEKQSKVGRNKYTRKMKKNYKETKLFNEINNFYSYRSKWFGSKDGSHQYIDRLSNILGSGIYVKCSRTKLRSFYKRQAAKKVRKELQHETFFNNGNTYKRIYGNLGNLLI